MIDFSKIKRIPLTQRYNKVTLKDIIPLNNNIPILKNKKQVIVMIGAHTIKVGVSLLLIDLIKRGIITHIAMNGASPIHDFEIAHQGATSEDVAKNIEDGTFGMADETGWFVNEAIKEGAKDGIGAGRAIGRKIVETDLRYVDYSILGNAYKLNVPATVHIAIGCDIIHVHPNCDGSSLGKAS